MRLSTVERGHALPQKLVLAVIRAVLRHRAPDVVRTLLYRPKHFGAPFSACLQAAMRGPSAWTVGERELFAAFTSRLNQCVF